MEQPDTVMMVSETAESDAGVKPDAGRGAKPERNSLVFRQLEIRRFLGIAGRTRQLLLPGGDGKLVFSPGINVIFGPNASGKTTAALALQVLLWPRAHEARHASLGGVFDFAGQEWAVDVESGRVLCRQDGVEAPLPAVGPEERRERYRLSLHELLRAEDRELAADIQNEINGGLNLRHAVDALGWDARLPNLNLKEYKHLRAMRERVQALQRKQYALRERQSTLRDLESEVAAARDAVSELALLDKVVAWWSLKRELETAHAEFEAFPPVLKQLAGNESEELAQLRGELAERRRQFEGATAAVATAARALAASGLSERQPTSVELAALESLLRDWQEQEAVLARLETALAGFTEAVRNARTRIGPAVDDGQLQRLESEQGMDALVDFAGEVEEVRAQEAALGAAIAYMSGAETDLDLAEDENRVRQALARLSQWLQDDQVRADWRRAMMPVLLMVAVLVPVLFGLAFRHSFYWMLGLAVPVVVLLGLFRCWRQAGDARASVARDYADTGLPAPKTWNGDDVRKCLDSLIERLAKLRMAAEKAQFVRARQNDLVSLRTRREALEARRNELVQRLGVPAATDDARLYLLVRNLAGWQEAGRELAKTQAQMAAVRSSLAGYRADFNTRYALFGDCRTAENRHEAQGLLLELQQRVKVWAENVQQRDFSQSLLESLSVDLAGLETRRCRILAKAGLPSESGSAVDESLEAEQRVRSLLERLPEYRKAESNCLALTRNLAAAESELKGAARFSPELLSLDEPGALEERRVEKRRCAADFELHLGELKQLESEISQAKRGHDLEAALNDLANAESALDEVRQNVECAGVGQLVLELIKKRNQVSASEVLKHAAALFAAITHDEFSLRVQEDETARFVAFDNRARQERALDELSSATRVQLLLAVRVAFIEQQEGNGPCLPLVLDELLGNSDDARARAVIQGIVEISRRGRQIFYFTAQHDEVAKWEALLAAEHEVEFRQYRLPTAAAAGMALTAFPALTTVAGEDIPQPLPEWSYHDYGCRLKVPSLDLFMQHAGQLHLWYVLTDAELLHRFLVAGYEQWGQVERLLENGGALAFRQLGIVQDALTVEQARINARLLLETARLWQIGRGQPVTRGTIYQSPLRNSKFIDQVAACVESCDGDALRLLDALEAKAVKGFGPTQIAKLKEFMEENECLSTAIPLTQDEVMARLDALAAAWVEGGLVSHARVRQIMTMFHDLNGKAEG